MKPFHDFVVDFDILFPFLLPNVLSASLQVVNNLCVVESEGHHRNFDWCLISLITIDAKAWKLRQPLLHLILDIQPELPDFRHRIHVIQIFVNEYFVHIGRYAKLARVIGRRHSFNIPINEFVVLNALHILDGRVHKEVEENAEACNSKAHYFPLG